jgi:cytoskeletal protein CcmA (bactofilin family)
MAFSDIEKNYTANSEQRTLLTITGDHAILDGQFTISQSIEIDCELKGKLTVDGKITIQKNGFVSADVKTEEAEIIGRYVGDMEASGSVVIMESGIAMGNIKTDSLVINKGGIFNGNITRITEARILLDEAPRTSILEAKPSSRQEENQRDSYNVSDFRNEDSQVIAYDVNASDGNNQV